MIIQFGIARSGNSLVYQILCKLFSDVQPHHKYIVSLNIDKCIIIKRDLKDVLVSTFRFLSKLDDPRVLERHEVIEYAKKIRDGIGHYNLYIANCHNPCILEYEKFVNDFDYIFDKLEKYYEINISKRKRNKIAKYCDIEKNRKRATKYKDWKGYDKKTNIHGQHICNGEVGQWKKYIKKEDYDLIKDLEW